MMKSVKIKQNWQDVVMHETTKVDKNVKSWKKCFGPVKPVRWTSRYKLPCITTLEPVKPCVTNLEPIKPVKLEPVTNSNQFQRFRQQTIKPVQIELLFHKD